MEEMGMFDIELIHQVQMAVNEIVWRTIDPLLDEFVPVEHLDFAKAYIKMSLKMMTHSEWQRIAVELGYNVHGDESGEVKLPDLTHYMPEIAHAFEEYLRQMLP
jgi:hypothetical protein